MAFLILSKKRSGTMLLTSYLNSHPEIVCDEENYVPEVWKKGIEREKEGVAEFVNTRQFLPERVGSWSSNSKVVKGGVWGVNLKYAPLAEDKNRFRKEGMGFFPKIIHLIRNDLLAAVISDFSTGRRKNVASERKYGKTTRSTIYHTYGNVLTFPITFPVDIERLYNHMKIRRREIDEWREYLRKSRDRKDVLEVYYENILPLGCLMSIQQANKICEFLGVKAVGLFSDMTKVNPDNPFEVLENWRKVESNKLIMEGRYYE